MASKMEKSVSKARRRMDNVKDLAKSLGFVAPSDSALRYSSKAIPEFKRKFGDFPGIKTAQGYQEYIDDRLNQKKDSKKIRDALKADSPRAKVGKGMMSAAQKFKDKYTK